MSIERHGGDLALDVLSFTEVRSLSRLLGERECGAVFGLGVGPGGGTLSTLALRLPAHEVSGDLAGERW